MTLNKVRTHLQRAAITLKDINDTYDSDLTPIRTMSSTTSQNTGAPTIGLQTAATDATNTTATYIDPHGEAQPEIPSAQVMHAMSTKSTQLQPKRQCLWCTGIGHSSERCYARDPANLKLFPNKNWLNGEVPNYFELRFNKKLTQKEAQKMVREVAVRNVGSCRAAEALRYHQVVRTPPLQEPSLQIPVTTMHPQAWTMTMTD
jgi:hypothetical protein